MICLIEIWVLAVVFPLGSYLYQLSFNFIIAINFYRHHQSENQYQADIRFKIKNKKKNCGLDVMRKVKEFQPFV